MVWAGRFLIAYGALWLIAAVVYFVAERVKGRHFRGWEKEMGE